MNDQYEGQGGSYALDPETGARTLIARTREPGGAPPERAPDTRGAVEPVQPTEVGFFTPVEPVLPADTTTTTE